MSQQGDNASKTSKKNTSHGQEDINAIINLDEDEDEEVQFVGVVRPPSVIDLIDLSVSPSTSQAAAAAAAGGAGDSLKTPDSETDASETSSGVTALNPQVIVVDPTAVAPAEAAAAVPTAAATAASASASAAAAPVAPALECPICLQTCIHPARLPCGHIFCFLCVKGVAYKNRRCAMCRREIPAEFLDHPQLVNGIDDICTTRATEDGYQWYYEGRNGWWQYDDRTSQDLEEAFKKGEHSCTILVAGYVYIVDLELLIQQRQNEPARCRRVKRDLATIAKKGVAGLRIEGNQVTCDTDFNRPPQNNTATVQRLINTFAARDAALRIASDIISSTIAQADELSLGLAASNISDSANDLSNGEQSQTNPLQSTRQQTTGHGLGHSTSRSLASSHSSSIQDLMLIATTDLLDSTEEIIENNQHTLDLFEQAINDFQALTASQRRRFADSSDEEDPPPGNARRGRQGGLEASEPDNERLGF